MLPRLRRFWLRLVHAARPERAEPDLAREVAAHLLLLEDELVRRGMTREAAYTEARRRLGGAESVKGQHRDARSFRWLDELRIDARYAMRRLRSRPATTALAVGMLAVAVGLSTAMFTIVDALLVRPLPFPYAERLTGLYMGTDTGGNTYVSSRIFAAWRESPGFDRVEGMAPRQVVVETDAGPVSHEAVVVTPGLFDLLGVRPLRGRLADAVTPEPDAIVIGATLWRTAFDSDEGILGRTVRIDDEPRVVIGVLPSSFRFPARDTSIWFAREVTPVAGDETQVIARLAAGVPTADAFRLATELAHEAEPATSRFYAREDGLIWGTDTYHERAVPFVAGAVALVVIVLCANVASLLLTRLRGRRREFGVCTALGASRGRLLRQTAIESLAAGAGGAVAGLAIAWMLATLAEARLPEAFRQASLNPIDLDLRALGVSGAMGLVVTFLAVAAPVWMATRVQSRGGNPLSERAGTASRAGRGVTRALLITEVAVACALLVGASLMVRSFQNINAIDRGFDPRGMVNLWFSFEESGITDPAARRVAAEDLRAEMLSLPGIADAAWSTGEGIYFGSWTSDLPNATPVRLDIGVTAVDSAYFDLYGIELLRGRTFSAQEEPGAVIVGERIANALWPGVDPLGRTFAWNDTTVRVVGIVREPRQTLINEDREEADMFVPFTGPRRYVWMNVRCGGSCPSEGMFRQRTDRVTRASLVDLTYLDDAFEQDLEQPRASATLVLVFALVALIASAGGLFSVLSHAVQERRREFGIRSALGASPEAIARVVYREGLLVGVIGLLLGAGLATAFASILESISYEASASDPVGVSIVAVTLILTIAFALWRPARDAARTDPALLLKEE